MHSPEEPLQIGKHRFQSRLFLGTGKYQSLETMRDALEASGTECVTVAVRRVPLGGSEPSLLDFIDRERYTLLPNTAGCYSADDAIRTARLGREAGWSDLLKLEVLGDRLTLLPDPVETLKATQVLVQEGFTVLTYTSDDPVIALQLQDAGAAVVMPLGSPIGSGQGINNPRNIRLIKNSLQVPMIVDAGVGTASHVAVAMELGADGVLLNTGVALADDPVCMAAAMKHAVEAGRLAFQAGRMPTREYASPSSPVEGKVATRGG
jgi:thiazole synthase